MFLQGKIGQGKTATAQHVLEMFEARSDQPNPDVDTVYVLCTNHKSSYKAVFDIVERYTGENPRSWTAQGLRNDVHCLGYLAEIVVGSSTDSNITSC